MNWETAVDSEIVCYCKNVDKGTIISAIKKGSHTLTEIKETTAACTGGNCKEMNPLGKCCSVDILELIKLYASEPDSSKKSCCCCNS